MPTITFHPSGRRCEVTSGTTLLEACRLAGVRLPAPCGGAGTCGKCRVRLLHPEGLSAGGMGCLSPAQLADGWRTACSATVERDLDLADPVETDGEAAFGHHAFAGREGGASGYWRRDLNLPPPSAEDRRDDLSRVREGLRGAGIDLPEAAFLPILSAIPGAVRGEGFRCLVEGIEDAPLAIRPPGSGAPLGLAVDLGTTSVAAALCDLATGEVLATGARANPQSAWGDDVISRIAHAGRGEGARRELSRAALGVIESLAGELRARAGLGELPLLAAAVAGNTVMGHLLLGIDPQALGRSPFVPAFTGPLFLSGARLGWTGPNPPGIFLIPAIASYVGGDISAGLLAHDDRLAEGNTLFLDVGTNGEIVLASGGELHACAVAAGPAFEGARIRHGMRATAGAISRVDLGPDGDLAMEVIGGGRAGGICGTGLLDAVAALLRGGVVDASGRMLEPEEAAALGVRPPLLSRLHRDGEGAAVWLERPSPGHDGVPLTARDVREFQLAKGAVAAGADILLRRAGLEPAALDRVLLAGGFGAFLRPSMAVAVGLLPGGVRAERVAAVGNASLAGARLYLISDRERRRADDLRRRVRYLELSGLDEFQHAFARHMLFPPEADHEGG